MITPNGPRFAHVGIAVSDLDAACELYQVLLAVPPVERETVESQGVEVAHFINAESQIELLQPTRDDSPIARFIAKRGEGIHHVAIWVHDLKEELARLAQCGVELIDKEPRVGAGGHLVAFVHPRGTRGVLVELTQRVGEEPR